MGNETEESILENPFQETSASQSRPVNEVAEPAKERLFKRKLAAVGEDLVDFLRGKAASWFFPVEPCGTGLARFVEVGAVVKGK
jgi:hypothetical protein